VENGEFVVSVKELEEGGREYVFPVRPAWLRASLEESDEVKPKNENGELVVRLSKSGRDVVVRGRVKMALEIPCARCLEPAAINVDTNVTALMVPKGSEHEDVDIVIYDGKNIVLDDIVRDEILLEIPMIPLCSEDCPGMRGALEKE